MDVVSVTAVVKDRKGKFVPDLKQEDFIVSEGTEQKRILDFRAETDGPVKLGLLVDASGSMRIGQIAVDARETARHLFSALRSDDEAALFSFDTRLDRVARSPPTRRRSMRRSARSIRPTVRRRLYDAIGEAATFVATRAAARDGCRSALRWS